MRRFWHWFRTPASARQCMVWVIWCFVQSIVYWWAAEWTYMWVFIVSFFGWTWLYKKARKREFETRQRHQKGRHA